MCLTVWIGKETERNGMAERGVSKPKSDEEAGQVVRNRKRKASRKSGKQ